jgi:hypothetical protein
MMTMMVMSQFDGDFLSILKRKWLKFYKTNFNNYETATKACHKQNSPLIVL